MEGVRAIYTTLGLVESFSSVKTLTRNVSGMHQSLQSTVNLPMHTIRSKQHPSLCHFYFASEACEMKTVLTQQKESPFLPLFLIGNKCLSSLQCQSCTLSLAQEHRLHSRRKSYTFSKLETHKLRVTAAVEGTEQGTKIRIQLTRNSSVQAPKGDYLDIVPAGYMY